MQRVASGGLELAYDEHGSGPAVVLVHGLAADAAAWGPLERLGLPARVISYDRRGYGGSEAPEVYAQTTVGEQAEDLAGVVGGLGAAPALLVGAGFGALVVLDVLLRHRPLARAAVLVDPPLHAFVPEATEVLSAERLALEDGLREGGPAEAVARWLGDEAEPGRVARARASARTFFADYAGLATLTLARGDLRRLDLPIAVVASPRSQAAADALLALVPDGRAFADWREAVAALL